MKFRVRFTKAKYENEIVSLCETSYEFIHVVFNSKIRTVKIDINNVEIFPHLVKFISSMKLLYKG